MLNIPVVVTTRICIAWVQLPIRSVPFSLVQQSGVEGFPVTISSLWKSGGFAKDLLVVIDQPQLRKLRTARLGEYFSLTASFTLYDHPVTQAQMVQIFRVVAGSLFKLR